MHNNLLRMAFFVCAFAVNNTACFAEDSPAKIGEAIFLGNDPTVIAKLLPNELVLQGRQVACSNCHGENGYGKKLNPKQIGPDINLKTLLEEAQERPAYNFESFVLAVRDGQRIDGHPLAETMPRFQIERVKLDALYAFLQAVHTEEHAGIEPSLIRLIQPIVKGKEQEAKSFAIAFRNELNLLLPSQSVFGRQILFESVHADQLASAGTPFAFVGSGLVPKDGTPSEELNSELSLFPISMASTMSETVVTLPELSPNASELQIEKLGKTAALLIYNTLLECGRDNLSKSTFLKFLQKAIMREKK